MDKPVQYRCIDDNKTIVLFGFSRSSYFGHFFSTNPKEHVHPSASLPVQITTQLCTVLKNTHAEDMPRPHKIAVCLREQNVSVSDHMNHKLDVPCKLR